MVKKQTNKEYLPMKVLFLVDSDFTTAQLVVENITLIKEKPVNFFWKMLSLQPANCSCIGCGGLPGE